MSDGATTGVRMRGADLRELPTPVALAPDARKDAVALDQSAYGWEEEMKLEHVALLVADPVAVAEWYEAHLGMRVVRKGDAPGHARFVADDAGASVLEIYAGTVPVPDYGTMDPALLHVAFATDDVEAARARLIAAGAVPVGEVVVTPAGDEFAMLRDPWGLSLQLARRVRALV